MTTPVTLITGATGGIGAALAHALAHHALVLFGRDAARLEMLRATLLNARAVPLELREPETFAATLEGLERVDNLILNAGIVQLGTVEETSLEVWRAMLEVNLLANVALVQTLLPRLREAKGQILFVNSVSGLHANAGWSAYAASKFALRAFAESLALEEPFVRVQSVYPGRTATPMQETVRSQEGAAYQPERYIQPETLAQTIRAMLELPRDSVMAQVVVHRSA
jgi:NAD(P)-dependent dehydrogenase (short-subunit alcohol dehydrogenase family)